MNEITRERLATDIDLTHPWVTKYRVPPVSSLYDFRYMYVATLVTGADSTLDNFLEPTDADAALVGEYIKFYKEFFYNERNIRELEEYPVDFEGGVNTTSFALSPTGWVYRKLTWRDQPRFPLFNSEISFPTLMSLIDNIEKRSDGSPSRWDEFKTRNNL